MDGSTEPIIAVIGHPIAGNPSQFALERALVAMQLDWRILSLDVRPKDIQKAIDGAWVMGMQGLFLDDAGAKAAVRQALKNPTGRNSGSGKGSVKQDKEGENTEEVTRKKLSAAPPTCFFRDSVGGDGFTRENAESKWLEEVIQNHFHAQQSSIGPVLWIGEPDVRFPSGMVDIDTQSPIAWAASESIEKSKLIVLSESVDVTSWPENDGTSMVIDLSKTSLQAYDDDVGVDFPALRKLGYSIVSAEELRAAALSQSLLRWTGARPPIEILQEAIEEYLAV